MQQTVSGDDVRATYRARVDWDARILDALRRHGSLTTRGMYHTGLKTALEYGAVVNALARLLDDGRIVAIRKPTTVRGGRPGLIWSAA